MKNIVILSNPYRPARRIATEIINAGHNAVIIRPSEIIGLNFNRNSFFVTPKPTRLKSSKFQNPIEVPIDSISGVISYCKHSITEHLNEVLGIEQTNSFNSIRLASNKYLSALRLNNRGIPVAKEALISSSDYRKKWLYDLFEFPFIMKSLNGSQGKGVYLVEDESSALELSKNLLDKNRNFIIQEFVNTASSNTKPHDFRLFVVNGRVVSTMKRIATTGIKTNHSIHHNSEPVVASEEMERIAIASMNALGLKIGGVDMAKDVNKNKWIVYEVNSCPGFGIEKVTKTNVGKVIADYSINKFKEVFIDLPNELPLFQLTEISSSDSKSDDVSEFKVFQKGVSQFI